MRRSPHAIPQSKMLPRRAVPIPPAPEDTMKFVLGMVVGSLGTLALLFTYTDELTILAKALEEYVNGRQDPS